MDNPFSSTHLGAAMQRSGHAALVMACIGLPWLAVTEICKHAMLAWISEQLGEQLGMHGPGDVIRWSIEHPFQLCTPLGVLYCIRTVWAAKLLSNPDKTERSLLYVPPSEGENTPSKWRFVRTVGLGLGIFTVMFVGVFLYGLLRGYSNPSVPTPAIATLSAGITDQVAKIPVATLPAHKPASAVQPTPRVINNCPNGICGDGTFVNPTVNNYTPKALVISADHKKLISSAMAKFSGGSVQIVINEPSTIETQTFGYALADALRTDPANMKVRVERGMWTGFCGVTFQGINTTVGPNQMMAYWKLVNTLVELGIVDTEILKVAVCSREEYPDEFNIAITRP